MKIKKEETITLYMETTEEEARIIRDALRADAERKRAGAEAMIKALDMELTYDGREELTIFREAVDEVESVMTGKR